MIPTEEEYEQMEQERNTQNLIAFSAFSSGMEGAKASGLHLEVFRLFVDQLRRNPEMTVAECMRHAFTIVRKRQ